MALALGIISIACAGCGDSSTDSRAFAQVKGTVKYHGGLLKSGRVNFVPVAGGNPASGVINPDGTYTMMTTQPGDGVVPGEYKVGVFNRKDDAPDNLDPGKPIPKSPDDVAEKYENPNTSEVKVTVNPGKNDIPIDLK